MKLHQVPAATGIRWVRQGIRTFWRQPLAMAGLFFMFMMAVSVLALIPWLGSALALAILPAATLGLMAATRDAEHGAFPMPAVLASAFRAGRERAKAMLILGGLYAVGSFVVMGLTSLLAGEVPAQLSTGKEVTEELLREPYVMRSIVLNMVFYIPLGLLFWHAPALVHWHGVSPVKSLFFSIMACWTNKAALLVYFVGWGLVFMATALVLVLVATLTGSHQVLNMLVFPAAMILSAMFFSSLYYTFRDSFITDDGQEPA